MTADEARAYIETLPWTITYEKQRVLRGLLILARYDDDIACAFEHDRMYASSFEETVVQMSKEEIKELIDLGWSEYEDCWTHG